MNMDLKKMRVWNTKKEGRLEFLIYLENGRYIGVCLTLDIVEESDDPRKLQKSIQEAAIGHVLLVIHKKLDNELLNRPAPEEYWEKDFEISEQIERKPSPGAFIFQMPLPIDSRALAHV